MSDIDFLLRKAVKSGLNYLSLSPNLSNPSGAKWCAAYRHVETNNCEYVDDDDPVEALEKAIRAGEREVKRIREHRATVGEPLERHAEKVQRRNSTKVLADETVKAKRRAEREDLA